MIPLPSNQAAINWTFGQPFTRLRFVIDIPTLPLNKDGLLSSKGIYLILYDQSINEVGSYLGLQTNLMRPGEGGGHAVTNSFGLLFSRWKSRSDDNIRIAPGGYLENAPHEGGFIGVRMPMKFVPGKYIVELNSGAVNEDNVWYDCTVMHPEQGKIDCGSLRFPLANNQNRGFHDHGGTNLELYRTNEAQNGMEAEHVPNWTFTIEQVVADDQLEPISARLTYPYENAVLSKMQICDGSKKLIVELGTKVNREIKQGNFFNCFANFSEEYLFNIISAKNLNFLSSFFTFSGALCDILQVANKTVLIKISYIALNFFLAIL